MSTSPPQTISTTSLHSLPTCNFSLTEIQHYRLFTTLHSNGPPHRPIPVHSPVSHPLPSNYHTLVLTHPYQLTLPVVPALSPHPPNSSHTQTPSTHHRHHRHHHQPTLPTKHHQTPSQCITTPIHNQIPHHSPKLTQTHPLSPMITTLSPHPHSLSPFPHLPSTPPFTLNSSPTTHTNTPPSHREQKVLSSPSTSSTTIHTCPPHTQENHLKSLSTLSRTLFISTLVIITIHPSCDKSYQNTHFELHPLPIQTRPILTPLYPTNSPKSPHPNIQTLESRNSGRRRATTLRPPPLNSSHRALSFLSARPLCARAPPPSSLFADRRSAPSPQLRGGLGVHPQRNFAFKVLLSPPFPPPFSSLSRVGRRVGIPPFWVCGWVI